VLPKAKRLQLSKNEKIFREGKRVGTPLLFLFFKEEKENNGAKVALVRGVKIDRRAVVRNKIRRLMAEAIRGYGKIKDGYKIVLVARRGILGKGLEEINRDVGSCLRKAGVF